MSDEAEKLQDIRLVAEALARPESWVESAGSFHTKDRTSDSTDFAGVDLERCRKLMDADVPAMCADLNEIANQSNVQTILSYYSIPVLCALPHSLAGISDIIGTLSAIASRLKSEYNVTIQQVIESMDSAVLETDHLGDE